MAERRMELLLDEYLARRLAARAAKDGEQLEDLILRDLRAWLGDWGLEFAVHVVRSGETLHSVAERYYGDGEQWPVIAAYNAIEAPDLVQVGQVLRIPEAEPQQPLPAGESPYIFGLHDRGGEHYMAWAGRKGWVLCTEAIGAGADDTSSRHYADLTEQGFGVIVRLNHGYGPNGTLPHSDRYGDFAQRCGNFVEYSSGCHIWVIANEPNLAVERPGGPANGEVITPQKYARAYQLCRDEIRSRSGHEDDQVIVAAVGPWNVQTKYAGNESGDWIVYFQHLLGTLDGHLDGMALHTYARDADPAKIVSEECMDAPFAHRRKQFRTYRDFMEAIPESLSHLPVYITETDQNIPWQNVNRGWIQEAYAEIDRWNADPTHQPIRSLILYRWERYPGDQWYIKDKMQVIEDFRDALRHDYRWRS